MLAAPRRGFRPHKDDICPAACDFIEVLTTRSAFVSSKRSMSSISTEVVVGACRFHAAPSEASSPTRQAKCGKLALNYSSMRFSWSGWWRSQQNIFQPSIKPTYLPTWTVPSYACLHRSSHWPQWWSTRLAWSFVLTAPVDAPSGTLRIVRYIHTG